MTNSKPSSNKNSNNRPHRITVGLLFGGKSGEHEVSLQSAKSVYDALDKERYNVVLIGIDKKGTWLLGDASTYLLNPSDPKHISLNKEIMSVVTPSDSHDVDVFFPLIHGTTGEDGALQGLLEMFDAAYVGAGVLGSAIGMDKDVMKRLLKAANIPVARYHVFNNHNVSDAELDELEEKFGYPMFVKPANMGSSVGVSKAHSRKELSVAIDDAFAYDLKILIEEYIEGREIECAVLGNDTPEASIPGEVIPHHEFYSYSAKYIDENGAGLVIPADISANQQAAIQSLAVSAFKTLECQGMARVDFFLTKSGTALVNEINTIPGFTKISMYPKLWAASGLPYPKLIDRLIALALERKREKKALKRSYTIA